MLRLMVAVVALVVALASARADDDVLVALDWTPERMVIQLSGEIAYDTASQFRQLAGERPGGTLVLRSVGGDVSASVAIGEAVRRLGWKTVVPMGSYCYSGCAMIWAAGVERRVGRSAEIGFHGPYITADDDLVYQQQFGGGYYRDYFAALGYSDEAITRFLVPPPSLFMLTPEDNGTLAIGAIFD